MAYIYHQLFCDESGQYHHPKVRHVTFAGVSATASPLSSFDQQWRALLRNYELESLHMKVISLLDQKVGYRFQPDQTVDERIDLLLPFVDCINKHLEMGFIQAWDLKGFERLCWEARQGLGNSENPKLWTFIRGISEIVDRLTPDDKLNIVCDDDEATAWDMYAHYRQVGKSKWEIQRAAIAISFANDVHFPALQAADMAAFLARCKAEEVFYKVPNQWARLYVRLTTEPHPAYGTMRWFESIHDEKSLAKAADSFMRLKREKKIARQQRGISKVRSNNEKANPGAARRNKTEVISRKGRKSQKAEG